MDKGIRNTLLGIAAFIALALGLLMASMLMPRGLTDQQALALGYYRFDAPRPLPEFSLLNHRGQPVGKESLQGQHSLLFFGFSNCPGICPATMRVLADSVQGQARHPQIVMVSVDPERDTPEKLAAYVPAFNPAFTGYTGAFDETVKLAVAVNIAFGKVPAASAEDGYEVDHSASLIHIDPAGNYAGFIKPPHQAKNLRRIYASLP